MVSPDDNAMMLALSLAAPYALVLASPGPNLLVILRLGLGRSLRATLAGALGIACGAATSATIACHGARLVGWVELLRVPFAILLALILMWSALRLLKSARTARVRHDTIPRLSKAFGLGITVAAANPMSLPFFLSFFITNQAFQTSPWMGPAIVFVMALSWFSAIALFCRLFGERALGSAVCLPAKAVLSFAMLAYAAHLVVTALQLQPGQG